nr:virulence factor [Parvularcula dongshanensis]
MLSKSSRAQRLDPPSFTSPSRRSLPVSASRPIASPVPKSVLILSGDGILPTFSWGLAHELRRRNVSADIIGAFAHFLKRRSEASLAKHVASRLERFDATASITLVGYSFGAVIAFAAPRLPDSMKRRIERVVLIAPATMTGFQFHPAGWLDGHGPDDLPTAPAIGRLVEEGFEVRLLYGAQDRVRARAPDGVVVETATLPGGHDLGSRFRSIAEHVVRPSRERRRDS